MNIKLINIISFLIILFETSCSFQERKNESLEYYFSQSLPDTLPILFFQEYLGGDMNVRDICFSIDYREFYFTQMSNDTFIMVSKYNSGKWEKPSPASFSGISCDFEPCISPDGNSLYFASTRLSVGKLSMQKDIDIWKVNCTNSGWSSPECLDSTINSNCMEYYPSVSKSGNLYFGRNDSALTRGDIYYSSLINDKYTVPEKLPPNVNLLSTSFNAFISPEENYIIFSTYIEENNHWHSDLFISHKDEQGIWESPINLGESINSKGNEISPWVSYDGKYLFFASTRLDSSGLDRMHKIYWVNTSIIENFNM